MSRSRNVQSRNVQLDQERESQEMSGQEKDCQEMSIKKSRSRNGRSRNVSTPGSTSCLPHWAPAVLRLFWISWETTIMGCSYGPQGTLNHIQHAPNPTSCWDPGPRYPRGVPWDQIFLSKFFSYDKNQMLFYTFWGFVLWKMLKNEKNRSFSAYLAII